ncbi:MAG: NAD(P)H-dependent oxidoreductase subunit E, partial [Planctomycetes bacterium]|nr:NAD(P)H-dependent oxidoreductase subunit E [Planctomycetota bacterium]
MEQTVDLRPITQPESDAERAAVDAVLGPGGAEPPVPAAAARGRRHLLLPAHNALQARVGWISPGGLGYAARRLAVPPAEAYGVAGFYALLSLA